MWERFSKLLLTGWKLGPTIVLLSQRVDDFGRLMIDSTTTNQRRVSVLACRSPAKINLTLQVLGRREDGYHDIRSVVVGLDLTDTLRFQQECDKGIELTCDQPGLPTDDRNLVVQAARKIASYGRYDVGVSIELFKRIPVGAGLGGGSGNAAVTLAALNRLWEVNLGEDELAGLGAAIGSDVPLFFSLPASEISGRGERVRPVALRWSGWVLLVFAGCEVSTGAVYQAWLPADSGVVTGDLTQAMTQAETADDLAALCRNDLEPAIFRVAPRVRALHQAVGALADKPVRISGAGQAAFVLFDDQEEAENLRTALVSRGIGTGTRLVKTMTGPLMIE
ncbi:MAG: 4-(cytidine 5'-diphospho)-2-C-methyl-D-erythritol kinase [Phycisphaerae bacterium]